MPKILCSKPLLALSVLLFSFRLVVLQFFSTPQKMLEFSRPKKIFPVLNRQAFCKRLDSAYWFSAQVFPGLKCNCFIKSLVYYHFLEKAGMPAKIKIGFERNAGKLRGSGHSWIDCSFIPTRNAGKNLETMLVFPEN